MPRRKKATTKKTTRKKATKSRLQQLGAIAKDFSFWKPAGKVLDRVEAQPTIFPSFDIATRVGGWPNRRVALVHGPSNHGKAQPVDEPVLTPDGWRPIGELEVGDQVIGSNGMPTTVIGVFPQGELETFHVFTDDGGKTRACGEHLWMTTTVNELNQGRYKRERITTGVDGKGSVKSTRDIIETIDAGHYIPIAAPWKGEHADLPIDPYIMGLLLGGGSFRNSSVRFTSTDSELHQSIGGWCDRVGDEYIVDGIEGRIVGGRRGVSKGSVTMSLLEGMGMRGKRSKEKGVGDMYVLASAEQRLALLQGLMDTDGSAPSVSSGACQSQFSTTSKALRDTVLFLVRSLGGKALRYTRLTEHIEEFCVMVNLPNAIEFRLSRKCRSKRVKTLRRRITTIEPAGHFECVCIKVGAPDSLYITNDFIVTHNTAFALGVGDSYLRAGHFFAFIDAEYTTPEAWLQTLMDRRASQPNFIAMRPLSYDEAVFGIRELVNKLAKHRNAKNIPEDTTCFIVVDSLRKLTPQGLIDKVMKGKDGMDGAKGRAAMMKAALNAQWLDELTPMLYHTNASLLFIARETENPNAGPWDPNFKVGGGKAILYDSSLAIRITRAGWVTKSKQKEGEKTPPVVYGEKHRVLIHKTKIGGKENKNSQAFFHTSNGVLTPQGFDRARDVAELGIQLGVIKQNGSWYSDTTTGEQWQGVHNMVKALSEDPKTLALTEETCRQVGAARHAQ